MAGTYTQSRRLVQRGQNNDGNYRASWRPNASWSPSTINVLLALYSQTTTSFRDRDPNGGYDEDPRQLIAESAALTRRPFDTGHEFATRKGGLTFSHPDWSARGSNGAFWRGPLCPTLPGDNITSSIREFPFSPIDLQYGTKAIKETLPTKSAANMSQLLVEILRDVPRLPGMAFSQGPLGGGRKSSTLNQSGLGAIGSEYLNLVFGWVPTVSDVLKICEAIVRKDEIIAQYIRDSGQNVRRRFEFDIKEETKVISTDQYSVPSGIGPLIAHWDWQNFFADQNDARGFADLSEKVTEKYYFTGAYTYLLEDVLSPSGTLARSAQIARRLLGVDGLTIDMAYQLAPWSWLLDYFGNVGDILSNATAFNRDSLVLRWGYLMRETRVYRYYRHSGIRFRSGPTGPFVRSELFSQKLRVKATPYGFGLNPDSFTAGQWAILIALGMSDRSGHLL